MNPVRVLILVIAAVAAIGMAFLLRGVLAGGDKPAPVAAAAEAAPKVRVLVAKRDLPPGTRLAAADLTWQAWPADGINPAFITDGPAPEPDKEGAAEKAARIAGEALGGGDNAIQALEGAVVREAILGGEPVTTRKIVRGGEGGYMSVMLDPGMRAMAVSVNVDTAAGGFILPGDRVDLLQAMEADEGEGMITRTVMRNVKVLAIDQAAKPEKDANTLVGAVATLEIPAEDQETLANAQIEAKAGGALVLALRSYADMAGRSSRGAAVAETGAISVFRGGEASEVTVRR